MTDYRARVNRGARPAVGERMTAHNCIPTDLGRYPPDATEWACHCGKRWRKGNYGGWTRVDPMQGDSDG